MDALFQTQSNELSTTTQKEKLFKDAERQWNTLSTEKGAPGRKVDFEIYKSILYNLEIRKVYLDSKLSLEKFSSIVGTFTPSYAGSISCLLEENADLQRFAENYFHYWNLMEGDKRSATISIIKTAGLSNLANLIRQINTEASGSFLPVGNLQNYDGVLKAPFYFFDFAQYYQSLSDENTYNALQECISQCVVYKRNTPFYATEEGTFPITAFSGMTTFIMQRELNDLNEEYTKLQWYKDINTH